MTKEEIIKKCNEVKELKELDDKFIYEIKNNSFVTGSSLFKEDKTTTDIDFVVHPDCIYDFDESIHSQNCIYLYGTSTDELEFHEAPDHYFQKEFRSAYGFYKGYLCNFLFMHSVDEYKKWKHATNKMKEFAKNSSNEEFIKLTTNKEYRVDLFESWKLEYKMVE